MRHAVFQVSLVGLSKYISKLFFYPPAVAPCHKSLGLGLVTCPKPTSLFDRSRSKPHASHKVNHGDGAPRLDDSFSSEPPLSPASRYKDHHHQNHAHDKTRFQARRRQFTTPGFPREGGEQQLCAHNHSRNVCRRAASRQWRSNQGRKESATGSAGV